MASSRLGPCQYLVLIAHTLPVLYANKQFRIVFICCMLGGDFLGNLVWLLYIALFAIMFIFIRECSDHSVIKNIQRCRHLLSTASSRVIGRNW